MRNSAPLAVSSLLALCVACGSDATAPRPLQVTLTANPVAARNGDQITFVANAQGPSLLGVVIIYGDGTSDQQPAAGAQTARVTFRHAYAQPGVYEVQARADDARAGSASASTSVQIQPSQ